MDGNKVVKGLRSSIEFYKNNAIEKLTIDQFENHIDQAECYARECYEYEKIKSDERMESFRAVITYGANAIKAAMIINGGGAVALLAFVGKIENSDLSASTINLSMALFYFALGVFLAAVGSGAAYFAQRSYHYSDNHLFGNILTFICATQIFMAYAFFFGGVYQAGASLGLSLPFSG